MQTKKTVQGEAWDVIAKSVYGSEYEMSALLAENTEHLDTLLFSGNKDIRLADREKVTVKVPAVWE